MKKEEELFVLGYQTNFLLYKIEKVFKNNKNWEKNSYHIYSFFYSKY